MRLPRQNLSPLNDDAKASGVHEFGHGPRRKQPAVPLGPYARIFSKRWAAMKLIWLQLHGAGLGFRLPFPSCWRIHGAHSCFD